MIFFTILRYVFSAIVTVVLAFSPNIAHFIAYTPVHSTTPVIEQTSVAPSLFEGIADIIRTRLHTDGRYQQASVIEAIATSSPISETPIEAALVNIFCTTREENTLRTITGSGVFIDKHGVILTNAHIAQLLLIGPTDKTQTHCVVRQGSPATAKYEAGLLYVSPAWIIHNASQISADKPSGTGENDFALLYVTRAMEGDLPATFPSLLPNPTAPLASPLEVRAAGYPAEMLTIENTGKPLVPTIATTSIAQLFTFGSGEIDLVAIAPSTVGEQGSSGGPIVNEDGSLIGLIVTRGNTRKEGAQSLRALTIAYIDRTLREETGLDLAHTLAGDIPHRAKAFHETVAPYLQKLLLNAS